MRVFCCLRVKALLVSTLRKTSMLQWDFVWDEHEHELDALDAAQRRGLALACVEETLTVYAQYLSTALRGEPQQLIAEGIASLRSGGKAPEHVADQLEELADDILPAGLWDLFMGLIHLVRSWDEMESDDALEVMSFAYQVVLDIEIISKLECETDEDQVRGMELESQACVKMLQRQLHLLKLAM
jgi:hypothetical protein